jgi:hypothetical protein
MGPIWWRKVTARWVTKGLTSLERREATKVVYDARAPFSYMKGSNRLGAANASECLRWRLWSRGGRDRWG